MGDEEIVEKICLGHLNGGNIVLPRGLRVFKEGLYCDICEKDNGNEDCPWYKPITFHFITVKPKILSLNEFIIKREFIFKPDGDHLKNGRFDYKNCLIQLV